MKKLKSLFFVFWICALVVSFSAAADDQPAIMRDGIKVIVQYDPQGPNNWIVASITFVNENSYRVEVTGWPVFTCEDGNKHESVFVPFSIDAGGTYWVNIQRYQACGNGRITNTDVKISVKKESP